MGKKRGGRGRKRAWEQHQQASEDTNGFTSNENNTNNNGTLYSRQSEQSQPSQKKPKERSLRETMGVEQVEVSLINTSDTTNESNDLPPLLEFDVTAPDNSTSTSSTSTAEQMLRKVWSHLASPNNKSPIWRPSPIQQHLWSLLLHTPYHIIGVASTGSGKTLAYALPTLVLSSHSIEATAAAILVLVPTRELVQQVSKVFCKTVNAYQKQQRHAHDSSRMDSLGVVSIHGGVNKERQQDQLESAATCGQSVVVATPGRLLDLYKTSSLLPIFSCVVLDEADQLSRDGDLGPQVDEILKMIASDNKDTTRLVLVSATYPERARVKFQSWLGNDTYAVVQINHRVHQNPATSATKEEATVPRVKACDSNLEAGNVVETGNVEEACTTSPHSSRDNSGSFARIPSHLQQVLHVCSEHKKPRKLLHTLKQIYQQFPNQQRSRPLGIIFVSKIEKIKHIAKLLEKEEIVYVELHSQLQSSHQRTTNLAQFACGQKPLLLATDLAARGLDIPSVHFVIQYDFPGNLQQYIHRCGRAGRSYHNNNTTAPKPTVYSFFTRNLKAMAADLVQLLEYNGAWVDPNLLALVNENSAGAEKTRTKEKTNVNHQDDATTRDDIAPTACVNLEKEDEDDSDDDVDDFPHLSASRIVLKRASHVSDPSSSSSSSSVDEG